MLYSVFMRRRFFCLFYKTFKENITADEIDYGYGDIYRITLFVCNMRASSTG